MSRVVLKAEDISKQYRLGLVGSGTIRDDFKRWWYQLQGKEDPFLKIGEANDRSTKGESDYVWSLKDINFEINQGDSVGIIGRNGAGKSTLLKILSQVTQPTTGKIYTKGRIASLLEVGTGFHPEMTGRENIYLNGAILGMRKHEIKRKLDEIIAFSGVERYIDTPVKRYSSGMYVRLAFAVAAHLESEILIVDEVLAVGDADFQDKCLGKMNDVSKGQGRTVLFVSHNMAAIQELCDKAILLDNGIITDFDRVEKVTEKYFRKNKEYLEKSINVNLKYDDNLAYWAVDKYATLSFQYDDKFTNYFVDFAFYDKHRNKLFSIEGSKCENPILASKMLELKILNPGIVNNIITMDIGFKKDKYGAYDFLESNALFINTLEVSNNNALKGGLIPKIYIKDDKFNEFRVLD